MQTVQKDRKAAYRSSTFQAERRAQLLVRRLHEIKLESARLVAESDALRRELQDVVAQIDSRTK